MDITHGSVTDKGLNPKRPHNEDNLLLLPGRGLFLVADGVGGRRGGEVASQAVVDIFTEAFRGVVRGDVQAIISTTIKAANTMIFRRSSEDADVDGMATTLALLFLDEERQRAVVAHVGDSRVYLLDGPKLELLTEDHSEATAAVRAGMLNPADVNSYARRNVINRALGAEEDVEADFREVPLRPLQRFLLCSDGITHHVTDFEIEGLLLSRRTPQQLCERLKQLCYSRGAEDNLTAIIVDISKHDYLDLEPEPSPAISEEPTVQVPRPSSIVVDLQSRTGPLTPDTGDADLPGGEDEVFEPAPTKQATRPRPSKSTNPADTDVPDIARETEPESETTLSRVRSLMTKAILFGVIALGVLVLDIVLGDPLSGRLRKTLRGRQIAQTPIYDRHPEDSDVAEIYEPFYNKQATPEVTRKQLMVLAKRYEDALATNAEDAAAKNKLMEVYFWLGRVQYADARYDELNRADEKQFADKYSEAAKTFERAKKLGLQSTDLSVYLAAAYLKSHGIIGVTSAGENLWPLVESPATAPKATAPTPTISPAVSPTVTPTATPAAAAAPVAKPTAKPARAAAAKSALIKGKGKTAKRR